MSRLQRKVAVITGGSSGIGLATAKRFLAEGAYVFITGRRQAELDKAVAEIGKNVTAIGGDVSNLDDLDRLYKEIAAKKGKIDIVFANAGIVEMVPTQAVTPEHFDNPDRVKPQKISPAKLKNALSEVNRNLTAAFEKLRPAEWLQKHESVSAEDFAKDPLRNRLAVLLSRINHVSFHSGQVRLAK
jgi:NAD(P)-dependent dehydrogenase (short-subunit alcohol dehydrogenase family)